MYGQPYYPQGSFSTEDNHTVAMNEERIAEAKQRIMVVKEKSEKE